MAHILIIDDKIDITNLVSDILGDDGHTTTEVHTVSQAEEALKTIEYDVIIIDIWLEDNKMDGIGLLRIIKKNSPHTPVIMMSGHATAGTAALAIKIGAHDFIEKPFKSEKISFVVRKALEMRRMSDSVATYSFDNIKSKLIGKSPEICLIREQCIKMAKNKNARLMIYGKRGSGKSMFCEIIHALSTRRNARLIEYTSHNKNEKQVCDDINGNAGNFSIFELAQHGTLVFHEIESFPYSAQEKILNIIQKNILEIRGKEIELDSRVIATTSATDEKLKELVNQKKLNNDLYERISINSIHAPTLQDTVEDIPLFIEYFLKSFSEKLKIPEPNIDKEAFSMMLTYNWPGNVRELKNVIEYFCIMSSCYGITEIGINNLPGNIIELNKEIGITTEDISSLSQKSYRDAKKVFEREYILLQLKKFGWSISKTANFIGLERTALHRKIKDLMISVHNLEND